MRTISASGLLFGVLIVCLTGGADVALAEVRTASLTDGENPTVGFDIAQVQVAFDRDLGRATVMTRLHQPVSTADRFASGLIDMRSNLWGRECSILAGTAAGDVGISIGRNYSSGELQASGRVNYRQESSVLPLTVSADGRELTVTVQEELLVGTNLRCLSASGHGRGAYDPRQPNGGPTFDDTEDVFFDGFDPSDPRNRVFSMSYRLPTPQRVKEGRGFRNMLGRVGCSISCRVKIDGHARVPRRGGGWQRVRGLNQTGSFRVRGNTSARVGFNLVRRERMRLAVLFERYGPVRFVITMKGTDVIGRTESVTRTVRLLPPKPRPSRPAPAPRTSCQGYSPCIAPGSDVDCAGGAGNGPRYIEGPVSITGPDPYGLDSDGDGVGCE